MRLLGGLLATCLFASACASDGAQNDSTALPEDSTEGGISVETREDVVVKKYDINGDGEPDVLEFLKKVQDPDDPNVVVKQLHRKKVDVNADGDFDTIRTYDDEGTPQKEKADVDLDGTFDLILYFEKGKLVRKEILDDTESVVATRFYEKGKIAEVERDTDGDGKVDFWEYYEKGNLNRIGKDVDGDGEIDKWIESTEEAKKAAKTAASAQSEAPTSAPTGGGGDGGGSGE
ncbi:MAG: hypothetical protein ABEL76_08080 [Bradymonadaceae bacterium]